MCAAKICVIDCDFVFMWSVLCLKVCNDVYFYDVFVFLNSVLRLREAFQICGGELML